MKATKFTLAAAACAMLFASCGATKNWSRQDKGVAIGAGSGAVVGGAIGKATGNTGLGAILGAAVGGVAGGVIGHRMDKQAKEIEQQVPGVKVDRVGEGIVVEFSEGVLFGYNQSTLNNTSAGTLDKLVRVLNAYPDTDIEIDGHTDSKGTDEYNLGLSQKRADATAAYLRSHSISSGRIATRAMGEQYPKYSNDTEQGRAGNRRVEFQITANAKMKEDARREAAKG